ncbi:MAG: PEP-CTERM sorting domain-containing protein [Myxococcota bacterium]
MRRSMSSGLLAAGLFAIGSSASALGITLSEMSSNGTPASVVDATLEFTDLGGGLLQLDVTNDTTSPNEYDISEIAFNLDGVTMLELDSPLSGWTLNGSAANVAVAPGAIMIDGFGNFEFHLVDGVGGDPDQIIPGETVTFIFTYTGTLAAGILEANSPEGKMVAGKFVNGPPDPECAGVIVPTPQCPEGESTEDSAFGASGSGAVIPEPATAWLLGIGIAGLLLSGRRRA